MISKPTGQVAGAVVGIALAISPALAGGHSRPHLLATSIGPLHTDGERYAAYIASSGQLTLIDTRRETAKAIPVDTGCQIDDAQRGVFLLNCPNSSGFDAPHVLGARTGSLLRVPGEGQTYFPNGDHFTRIGSRWLSGVTAANGHPTREYLNWRTGEVKDFGEEIVEPVVPRNLNSAALSPIGRRGSFQVFLRRGSTTVSERIAAGPSSLVLQRPSRRPVRLDRCSRGCSSVELGRGLVSWASGATAHVYRIARRARLSWHFSQPISEPATGLADGVQLTSHRLYFNVPIGQSPADGFRILATKTP